MPQEKLKERHRAERAVHDTKKEYNTSDREFDVVRKKISVSMVLITK